jgi:hypothetical protein
MLQKTSVIVTTTHGDRASDISTSTAKPQGRYGWPAAVARRTIIIELL